MRTSKDLSGPTTTPRKIITQCVCPPIPTRKFDWQAYDADTYDGPGSPLGEGATEQAAIDDLLEQLEDRTPPRVSSVPEEGFEMARTRDELFGLCGKASDILYAARQHNISAEEWNPETAAILGKAHEELTATQGWLVAMRWNRQPAEREVAA